jgi:CHAT domain-containing protein
LRHAQDELDSVARHHPGATILVGPSATTAALSTAIAGAGLVHLVCHGDFAASNPMFSSLRLHDGPLFVYDIERLTSPPDAVVLPSCYGGLDVGRPAGQLLGTVASLLAVGTRTVVAAAMRVPDRSDTVEAMDAFHAGLARGQGAARALATLRESHPIVGGAFTCAGTG